MATEVNLDFDKNIPVFKPTPNNEDQVVRPPETDSMPGRGDDDNESRHRGFWRASDLKSDPALAPRNELNGQPGFDAVQNQRNARVDWKNVMSGQR